MGPRRIAVLLLAVLIQGCVAGMGVGDGSRRDRESITSQELEELFAYDALEAVRRLRPAWVRPRAAAAAPAAAPGCPRGTAESTGCAVEPPTATPGMTDSSSGLPYIFLDGAPFGPLETLASLRVERIQEIHFISPLEAPVRYGGQFQAGVILVQTRVRE